ncbi:hypothetical protein RI367_006962 [Sorochytrium milnesiophthora]
MPPSRTPLGGLLTTIKSSIHLHDDTRPDHSATLKLETLQGSMAIGMVVDQGGKLNFTCRTQDSRGHIKELTVRAASVPGVKVDLHHDVDVHIKVYMRGSRSYELRGSLASTPGVPYRLCTTTLLPISAARLVAGLTSSPPREPNDSDVLVSFLHPEVTIHQLSPQHDELQVFKRQDKRWRKSNPEEWAGEKDDRHYLMHVWSTDKQSSVAKPQRTP